MKIFKLDHVVLHNESLPSFEVTLKDSETTAIYSDTDTQVELIKALEKHEELTTLDQKDGLYVKAS